MKSVKSSSRIKQIKRSNFKVATKVLRNKLNMQKILRIIENPNIFQTRWKTQAFTFINYIPKLIAQRLDENRVHFLNARKFCRRPTSSEVVASEQSLWSASI